jgi:hypothetical protein
MNRELTLHIGTSKTGSSSIQRVLAGQREALKAQGAYMPTSPGWANHAMLPAALVSDPKILWGFHPATWEGMKPAERIAQFCDEFPAEMAALPNWVKHAVITAEQIGGLLRSTEEVQRLADQLTPYFAKIRVVVYLRRQDLHAASAYSQWLRGGLLVEPGLPAGGPRELPEYDYGALVSRYALVFGEDAVVPRIFSRDLLVNGDVVEDFLRIAGLRLDIPPEDPKLQANLSLNTKGQQLMLQAGRYLEKSKGGELWRDTPQWRQFAEAVTRALPGRGWRPTQDEAAAFMQRFAATNEAVRRRYFPQRASLFDMDFSDLPAKPASADPEGTTEAALHVVLHEMTLSAEREAAFSMAQFRLFKRIGDQDGMRNMLTRAIKFAPDLVLARQRMAELCLEQNELRKAREHADAALALEPQNPKLQRLRRRAEGNGQSQAPSDRVVASEP